MGPSFSRRHLLTVPEKIIKGDKLRMSPSVKMCI